MESTHDLRTSAGAADLAQRVADLAEHLPEGLKPLAAVAYNYRWSWYPGGEDVFRDINPHRWGLSAGNPVRFLSDLWPSTRAHADGDTALRERVLRLAEHLAEDLARPFQPTGLDGPVAYLCAEYGVHASLPIYSGGLGVLAGDTLKEASDRELPFVAVGLLYRRGFPRQRLDTSGHQLEYWVVNDPKGLPMARVSVDGRPLKLSVDVFGRPTSFQVWRVDVGRVPLFLIDAEIPENDQVQRWYATRLYEGGRALRLAQYALLGVGSVRLLHALGIEPGVFHLNEGHPALAALELAAEDVAAGSSTDDALERVRQRFVFTTHTPVPAGNETYDREELLAVLPDLPARLGLDEETFLGLFRTSPDDRTEPAGFTQLALRLSRVRNGVSRLHGEVARKMWRPLYPGSEEEDVPITHVTNGAHLPTFLSAPFRGLFDRHLGEGWERRAGDPRTWEPVESIPDAELWQARCAAREQLIAYVRQKSEVDRLQRGEQIEYVRSAATTFDADALTLGFARRLALYKRVYLLAYDAERVTRLLTGSPPVQLVVAGKAHPRDEEGKDALRALFALKRQSQAIASRMVVLEDYDLSVARELVAGCDVWINLPRRPLEASGTSGMKATFNGALQLSVLDGWWAEAFDGSNGWAIPAVDASDPDEADAHDARAFYDLLEHEVLPLFHDRDEDGIPHGWCAKTKAALLTCAPRFTTARMLDEYLRHVYAPASRLEAVARVD
ncbi:MAG TPA: alpha-glucan family phosphorylase [Gaiellaceae bacterium]|nr:alpha-glucan family phosphorylase [Gaiellaceae bacterium]